MKRLGLILSFLLLSTLNQSTIIGYCDIKGYVKNPGVYKIKENYTIQDVIKLAGGLKNKAYTDNINLSKKVTDEMVIYIFNEQEIEEANKLNSCECAPIYKYIDCIKEEIPTTKIIITTKPIETTTTASTVTPTTTTTIIPTTTNIQTTTKKENMTTEYIINLNTCTIEDLIKLDGLGEVKAKNIIDYRNNNGLFESIEDILKVTGIGNTTFEKIKNFIKV